MSISCHLCCPAMAIPWVSGHGLMARIVIGNKHSVHTNGAGPLRRAAVGSSSMWAAQACRLPCTGTHSAHPPFKAAQGRMGMRQPSKRRQRGGRAGGGDSG